MVRAAAPPAIRKRGIGLALVFVALLLALLGAIAIFAQRIPDTPIPPVRVAHVAEVSMTPELLQVEMARGLDRVLQRRDERFGWCPGMGCPGTIVVRPTPVFLVRDEDGVIRAFIGEDPKTGCALELLRKGDWGHRDPGYPAVFHDTCHGSLYDRRGKVAGGPSPWDLNQIAVEIRGEDVYVHPSQIVVGESRL